MKATVSARADQSFGSDEVEIGFGDLRRSTKCDI
jgi:hypothetical protein